MHIMTGRNQQMNLHTFMMATKKMNMSIMNTIMENIYLNQGITWPPAILDFQSMVSSSLGNSQI